MKNLLLFPIHDDDHDADRLSSGKRRRGNKPSGSVRNRTDVAKMDDVADSTRQSHLFENRLIRASAGTGKTYQLTSRYLRLLLTGASPESILATTFTRKAAGEIVDRVVLWLANAATDPKALRDLSVAVEIPQLTSADCAQKLAMLTRQIHRLRIYTLDAFFMQVALSFSLELGMMPGWQVLEEGGAESSRLRDAAISDVLRQESLDDLLVLMHQLAPKGEVKRDLDGMLRSRVFDAYHLFLESSPDAWESVEVPPPLSDESLAELVREWSALPLKNKRIPEARDADVQRVVNEDWHGFFQGGSSLVRAVSEGKEKYGSAKIPEPLTAIYRRFLPHLRSKILQSARSQTTATRDFLAKFHAAYRELKDGQRLYSFDEVTRKIAAKDTIARLPSRMDSSIDHLLLDEFQDTSVSQWKALQSLARHCTQNQLGRSFFCVGDVKQAIYGWRGGSSEIFDLLDERLEKLAHLDLKESRRSSPVIIRCVNRVFDTLRTWDESRLGRSRRAARKWDFEAHSTFRQGLPGYFAIETAGEASHQKDEQERAVFHRVAERIAEISEQAKGRTIGVLCRRNAKVGQIMNELQRLGVPASEEGGNHLTDSAAVELVLSLLQLVDHPTDTVSLFHLAASPWGPQLGLRLNKPAPIVPGAPSKETDADGTHAETQSRSFEPIVDPRSVRTLVRNVRRTLQDEGFGDAVQGWALQLRRFCNRRESRRLSQLTEKAYEFQARIDSATHLGYQVQRRQSGRPAEFVRFIRETKVADPSNAAVRVMTVHQAKGLEFDVVILPDVLGPFVEGHDTFLYRRAAIDSEIDLVCRYMGKDSGRSFLPDHFQPLFDDFEDRAARESFCVLYVAMTRAIHALHVFLPSGMQFLRGSKGHPAYLIKDTFMPGVKLEPDRVMYDDGEKHWYLKTEAPCPPPAADVLPPQPKLRPQVGRRRFLDVVAPSQVGTPRVVRLGEMFSRSGRDGRDQGLLMHAWLSKIEWLTSAADIPAEEQLMQMAQALGLSADAADSVLRFKELLVNEPLTTILSRSRYLASLEAPANLDRSKVALEVRNEQRVAGRSEGAIITGTVDRLVLIRQGEQLVAAEVIDYKTDTTGRTSEDHRLRTEHYRPQMEAYCQALAASLRLDEANIFWQLVFI